MRGGRGKKHVIVVERDVGFAKMLLGMRPCCDALQNVRYATWVFDVRFPRLIVGCF